MPKLNIDEVKQAIADGQIGAVTLDTNIFDRFECNLRARALMSMAQFRGTQTEFVLSQVVADEVRSHIALQADGALADLKRAVKDAKKYWRRDMQIEAAREALGMVETPSEFMEALFGGYTEATKLTCVPLDGLVLPSAVFERYFASTAPFAPGDRKKSEFPDAFALLSLEAWAKERNTKIIAVSDDKDWKKFGDTSDFVIVIDTLEGTLGAFNSNALFLANRIMQMLHDNAAESLKSQIEETITEMIDLLDPEIQGHTVADEWEVSGLYMELRSWEPTIDEPDVLEATEDEITFSFTAYANVSFEADISFSARDPIDGDYIGLGTKTFQSVRSVEVPIVVTVPREIDDEPEAIEISATAVRVFVDYGELNPYFYDNDED